jgi:hypothetical protein
MGSAFPLQLQLAYILHRTSAWEGRTSIRIISVVEDVMAAEGERRRILETVNPFRFEATIRIVALRGGAETHGPLVTDALADGSMTAPAMMRDAALMNEIMRHHAEATCVCFVPLPPLPMSSKR